MKEFKRIFKLIYLFATLHVSIITMYDICSITSDYDIAIKLTTVCAGAWAVWFTYLKDWK